MLAIFNKQPQLFYRIRQVVLIVVFSYSEQNWSNEITMGSSELHHELATEQLPDKWFIDDIGCEELLGPVWSGGQTLDILAHALPDRVFEPGLLVYSSIKVGNVLTQR